MLVRVINGAGSIFKFDLRFFIWDLSLYCYNGQTHYLNFYTILFRQKVIDAALQCANNVNDVKIRASFESMLVVFVYEFYWSVEIQVNGGSGDSFEELLPYVKYD